MRSILTALSVSLVLASPMLLSCSSEESTPATGSVVIQEIGPAGGTIKVAGATVSFPPGALTEKTAITISEMNDAPPAGFTALSKIFKCEPSGTEFAADVRMEMPFNPDGKPVKMFWSTGSDPTFKDIGGEQQGSLVVATVKHFSSGFVGRQN